MIICDHMCTIGNLIVHVSKKSKFWSWLQLGSHKQKSKATLFRYPVVQPQRQGQNLFFQTEISKSNLTSFI